MPMPSSRGPQTLCLLAASSSSAGLGCLLGGLEMQTWGLPLSGAKAACGGSRGSEPFLPLLRHSAFALRVVEELGHPSVTRGA